MGTQTKIGTHAGAEIYLDQEAGTFWADVDGGPSRDGGERLRAVSLAALRKRLDDRVRLAARAKARELDVVVYTHWDEDDKDKWHRGAYIGFNAHTGDVKVLLKDGTKRDFSGDAWFFLASQTEAIEAVKAAITKERAAYKEHEKLRDAREALLEEKAVQMGRHWSSRTGDLTKSEVAAKAEEVFVERLTKAAT